MVYRDMMGLAKEGRNFAMKRKVYSGFDLTVELGVGSKHGLLGDFMVSRCWKMTRLLPTR